MRYTQLLTFLTIVLAFLWSSTTADEVAELDRARHHLASILISYVHGRLTPSIETLELSGSEVSKLIESVAMGSASCRLESMKFLGDELFQELLDSYANGDPSSTQETIIKDAIRANPNLEATYVEINQFIQACEELVGQELGVKF